MSKLPSREMIPENFDAAYYGPYTYPSLLRGIFLQEGGQRRCERMFLFCLELGGTFCVHIIVLKVQVRIQSVSQTMVSRSPEPEPQDDAKFRIQKLHPKSHTLESFSLLSLQNNIETLTFDIDHGTWRLPRSVVPVMESCGYFESFYHLQLLLLFCLY
jgi:hypothetical protein